MFVRLVATYSTFFVGFLVEEEDERVFMLGLLVRDVNEGTNKGLATELPR